MAAKPVSVVCVEDGRFEVLPVALVVHSSAPLTELKRLLRGVVGEQRTFVAASATFAEQVRRARQQYPDFALGALVQGREQLWAALTAGADDVMLCSALTGAAALEEFVERVRLRAAERRVRDRPPPSEQREWEGMSSLLAGLAHEVNNPLTALQLTVEAFAAQMAPLAEAARTLRGLARAGEGASVNQVQWLAAQLASCHCETEGRELLAEMTDAARVVADVVRDVRVLSRLQRDDEEHRLVRVHDIIDQAVRLVGREIDKHGTIERDYRAEDALVSVPGARLTQVLVNVLINASHAIAEQPGPLHRVRIGTRLREGHVTISISDTGPGIAPGVLEYIFDPYFTTKGELGTGLGLSIARKIMREMGGELLVRSVYGDGATFELHVPVADSAVLRTTSSGSESLRAPLPARQASLLVADRDERVLKALVRLLGRRYHLMLARDAEEAMQWISQAPTVSAVIADCTLVDRRGQQLVHWLQLIHPKLAQRTIYIASNDEALPVRSSFGLQLRKPLAPAALDAALRTALQREFGNEGDDLVPIESTIRELR